MDTVDLLRGDSLSSRPRLKAVDPTTIRLVAVIVLIGLFVICTFTFGLITKSLSLFSEGFHSCSDLISYVVGLYAHRTSIGRQHNPTYPFGKRRASVVGGLFNGIFLLASSTFLVLEVIAKIIVPEEVEHTMWIMITGCIGVAVNFTGAILLLGSQAQEYGHGHGHGHSHGKGSAHKHKHRQQHKGRDLNLSGIIIHLMVDCVSNVCVVITGAVMTYSNVAWKDKLDIVAACIIIVLIICLSVPLIARAVGILMQSVREEDLKAVREAIADVEGVADITRLDVWRLDDLKLVVAVHLKAQTSAGANTKNGSDALTHTHAHAHTRLVAAVKEALSEMDVVAVTVEVAWEGTVNGYGAVDDGGVAIN